MAMPVAMGIVMILGLVQGFLLTADSFAVYHFLNGLHATVLIQVFAIVNAFGREVDIDSLLTISIFILSKHHSDIFSL